MNYYPARKTLLLAIEDKVLVLLQKRTSEKELNAFILKTDAYESEIKKVLWNAEKRYYKIYAEKIQTDLLAYMSEIDIVDKYKEEVAPKLVQEIIRDEKKIIVSQTNKKVAKMVRQGDGVDKITRYCSNTFVSKAEIGNMIKKHRTAFKIQKRTTAGNNMLGGFALIVGVIGLIYAFDGVIILYGLLIYGIGLFFKGVVGYV